MIQASHSSSTGPGPGSALSAFLRGIERRAYVLALAQCGQPPLARAALSQTLRAFQSVAGSTPLSAWPATFWSLLLAQPELSQGAAGVDELQALSSGPRAALLLRLVAGLDFAHASQVLGVSEDAYRYASQRALAQLGDAGMSYARLAALRERLHRQIKALPEADLQALADTREQALAEPLPVTSAEDDAARPRSRRWMGWAMAGLALAFAATWWPASAPPLAPGATQSLSEAAPMPVAAIPTDADRVIHPDYEVLADPALAALAGRLAMLSWWSSERGAGAEVTAPAEPVVDALPASDAPIKIPAAQADLLAPLLSSWGRLDAATRQRVVANARHWQSLAPTESKALVARMNAWDARPGSERALERAAYVAWSRLPPGEQAALRALDAEWQALPAAEQQRLQTAFAALPPDQLQEWWLGPRAGAGFAALRPLFAFVPEAERAGLIDLLRELPDSARDDLAQLAARLPADAREQLRRELLAQPAVERAAWIKARLTTPALP